MEEERKTLFCDKLQEKKEAIANGMQKGSPQKFVSSTSNLCCLTLTSNLYSESNSDTDSDSLSSHNRVNGSSSGSDVGMISPTVVVNPLQSRESRQASTWMSQKRRRTMSTTAAGEREISSVSDGSTRDAVQPPTAAVFSSLAEPFQPPAKAMKRRAQLNLLTMGPCEHLPLYERQDVPHWLTRNPYVCTGYRAYYTTTQTLCSLAGWHNESINIWSHMVGLFLFIVLTVVLCMTLLFAPVEQSMTLEGSCLVYGLFCAGCMLCMLNSSIFHLFSCHCNKKVSFFMGQLDFLGITLLIVVSFLPPLYMLFHCHPTLRAVYMTCIVSLGMVGVVVPGTEAFSQRVTVRTSIYLAMGLSGIIPCFHALLILPITSMTVWPFYGLLLMMALYVCGVVIYVTRFPECLFPGKFDFLFSSHQLWHFFVLMAALVHYCNCVSMLQLLKISNGAC